MPLGNRRMIGLWIEEDATALLSASNDWMSSSLVDGGFYELKALE